MNLLERVLTLLRANLNNVVEKADDPEKILGQLKLDMHNQLMQVKTQVATAIAEGHRLQKRIEEKTVEADSWLKKAKQAVQQGNDNSAREALARYDDIIRQAQRYKQQKAEQEQLIITLRKALRQLEAKISDAETTIEQLKHEKTNALIKQRAYEALQKVEGIGSKESAARARDAVMDVKARARAAEELHKRDLDAQFDALAQEQQERDIEQRRQRMQAEQKGSYQPPLLSEGGMAQPAPLIPPLPRSGEPAHKSLLTRNQPNRLQAEPQDPDRKRIEELLDLSQNRPMQE